MDKEMVALIQDYEKNGNGGGFTPYAMSIKKMCEVVGRPECLTSIRNRIFRAINEDERLSYHVRIDLSDLENLLITEDENGVLVRILMGYFKKRDIQEAFGYVALNNEIAKVSLEHYRYLHSLSKQELRRMLEHYKSGAEDSDITETAIANIQEELKRRKFDFSKLYKRPARI